MNLLIVDDEYYIVQGLLRSIGQNFSEIKQIFAAYSIDQAKKVIEHEEIDILLTDIEMPQGNGLHLIEWIRINGYRITPLILSGHQRFDYAQKAITMHCFGYILKPIDTASLLTEIKRAIQNVEIQNMESVQVSEGLFAEADTFVKKIREYIYVNLGSANLNRSTIAEHMHMNPDYLSSLFHNRFGQTLSTYITNVRIDKAKELLLTTRISLDAIAEQTGFSSSSYFHKQFKKGTGLTPQQYRNQQ